jgi:SAM-dependent methyltransferase
MTTQGLEKIQTDFDRIATLLARRPEKVEPYDDFLLQKVPDHCGSLLEVGSGAGRLGRLLTTRAETVVGIDASREMTALARARSQSYPTIRFECADFMEYPFGDARYDCVLSVTTLHHLPAGPALARMKSLLNPGAVLILHDVRAPSGIMDWIRSGLKATLTGEIRYWLWRRLSDRGDLSRAWRDHGSTEEYLQMEDVRSLCAEHLPGARVYSHPLWRYTIEWTNE